MRLIVDIKSIDNIELVSTVGLFGSTYYKQWWYSDIQDEIINGVYLLFNKGELIRVGQSMNMWARLKQHTKTIIFDSFSIIECSDETTKYLTEMIYTIYYKPKFNKKLKYGV